MKQTITLLLLFPFMIFFMFQPFMTELVHIRGSVFENLTDKYTKLAAREGYLSNELKSELIAEIEGLHFDPSKLIISATSSPVERGQAITVIVEYPIGNVFILRDWFNQDSDMGNYRFIATEMSEYIP